MNIFLVTSPFQYICALEAKAHYKTKNNILLLVQQCFDSGLSQQNKIVCEEEWDFVIKITRTHRTINMHKTIKSIWKLTQGKNIKHFFYGEYTSWRTKLLLRNLKVDKEVYFDDGTLTINEYEEEIRPKTTYFKKRFFNSIILKLQGIEPIGKMRQSKNLELFTIFDIINPEHNIIKNRLNETIKRYRKNILFSELGAAGFIGQGAIGANNQKTEAAYISEVEDFCKKNNSVIYFPHRSESESIREKIENIPNITYHKSEYPLEIELLDKNIILSKLVGTNSTVLFTAKILFPDMNVFFIETSMTDYSQRNKTRNHRIINYLKNANIRKF